MFCSSSPRGGLTAFRALATLLLLVTPVAAQAPAETEAPPEQAGSEAAGVEESSQAVAADEHRTQARTTYEQAVRAYNERRYKDAVDLFERANELSPNPAFSFNVGMAYEDMGDAARALAYYRKYVRQAPNASDRAEVDMRIQRLEQGLMQKGVQQVTIMSTPQGATFAIDGKVMGVTPWTGEIPPGYHKLSLQLRGFQDEERSFDLPPARSIDVPVTLTQAQETSIAPAVQQSPVSPRAVDERPVDTASCSGVSCVSVTSWTVTGGGIAALGVALGFELARARNVKNSKEDPVQVSAAKLLQQARDQQKWATAFALTGGALTIVGGALLFTDLYSSGETEQSRLTGGCSPFGCDIAWAGTF